MKLTPDARKHQDSGSLEPLHILFFKELFRPSF